MPIVRWACGCFRGGEGRVKGAQVLSFNSSNLAFIVGFPRVSFLMVTS